MKTKYYAYHPRRFGNEYNVIRVASPEDDARLDAWYNNYKADPANYLFYRVTAKELRRMCANERHARRFDPAFSGFCAPWNPLTVEEFIGR